jgi:ribosomal protein S18 acetylase RimI-like enzyme
MVCRPQGGRSTPYRRRRIGIGRDLSRPQAFVRTGLTVLEGVPRWAQVGKDSGTTRVNSRGARVGTEDTVLIRDFRKSDIDDLLDLLPKCFAQEFEVSGFDPERVRSMVNRIFGTTGGLFLTVMRLLGKEPVKFFVAVAEGRFVGTTIVSRSGKVGYISAVMVHPDYRRRGIATALMKSAIEHVQERRMDRAVLDAVVTNAQAISVYSKLGFKEFEQVANFVGDIESVPTQAKGEVEVRPYSKGDLHEVYNLIQTVGEPDHLRVYGFSEKSLRAPFWSRLFRFSTQKRFVAVRGGRIVGYVSASYTSPKEAGSISSISVNPEDRARGVEATLMAAASEEIRQGGVGRVRVAIPTSRRELLEAAKGLGFKESLTLVGMNRETRS